MDKQLCEEARRVIGVHYVFLFLKKLLNVKANISWQIN